MGRKPTPRVHYLSDANFLIRLSSAIEVDERRPPEWRREILGHLRQVISMFSQDALEKKPKP